MCVWCVRGGGATEGRGADVDAMLCGTREIVEEIATGGAAENGFGEGGNGNDVLNTGRRVERLPVECR